MKNRRDRAFKKRFARLPPHNLYQPCNRYQCLLGVGQGRM